MVRGQPSDRYIELCEKRAIFPEEHPVNQLDAEDPKESEEEPTPDPEL